MRIKPMSNRKRPRHNVTTLLGLLRPWDFPLLNTLERAARWGRDLLRLHRAAFLCWCPTITPRRAGNIGGDWRSQLQGGSFEQLRHGWLEGGQRIRFELYRNDQRRCMLHFMD